jgi:hypothetical protein
VLSGIIGRRVPIGDFLHQPSNPMAQPWISGGNRNIT